MNIFGSLMIGLGLVSQQVVAQDGGSTPCPPSVVREASPSEIRTFFQARQMKVLSFFGYSGAGYEDEARMLSEATKVLDQADPRDTLVNIGATLEGIGAVYDIAKRKGFTTTGIVSTEARDNQVPLARCVDYVFFVKDGSWGGFLPGTTQLSPTSAAMVENSDVLVAIGGGEVARDELRVAKQAGKAVQFIPADMNHAAAIEKAKKKGQPVPTEFRGAAAEAFD